LNFLEFHDVYGGNKIRKFEFIVPEIQKQKANHVYTFGGTGTNHGVATAVICNQLGLKASVITLPANSNKLDMSKLAAAIFFALMGQFLIIKCE
jgi:D-cysteine desulfhydrase